MLLNVRLLVNLLDICARQQLRMDRDLMRANALWKMFDYQNGDKVLKKIHNPMQLGQRWEGPYPIERVHVNGNVTIVLRPGVIERINMCRLKPYHEPTSPPHAVGEEDVVI